LIKAFCNGFQADRLNIMVVMRIVALLGTKFDRPHRFKTCEVLKSKARSLPCPPAANKETLFSSSNMIKTHAFRLRPGTDLKKEIASFVKTNGIQAGWIGCAVGSLIDYHIRFANQERGSKGSGHFEILSLTGTVSIHGLHLHISISDEKGKTIGGHLLEGNIVYTTAEIVIQEPEEFIFLREKDGTTPWEELQVRRKADEQMKDGG
jgi:predicted DNA-binding protein with PD1-like motif